MSFARRAVREEARPVPPLLGAGACGFSAGWVLGFSSRSPAGRAYPGG